MYNFSIAHYPLVCVVCSLCPDGYFIKSLEPHHALELASRFAAFAERPLEVRRRYFEHLIQHVESAGVFSVDDPSRGIAMNIQHSHGYLGYMYTLPEYQKQGFAMLIMLEMVRRVLANGDMPGGFITFESNTRLSNKFLGTLRMVPIGQTTRLVVKEASGSSGP